MRKGSGRGCRICMKEGQEEARWKRDGSSDELRWSSEGVGGRIERVAREL